MPRRPIRPRSRKLYRVVVAIAAISVAFGAWSVAVGRNPWRGLFWELIFPLLVLALALTLYRRSQRTRG
jgi:hypothetical protein